MKKVILILFVAVIAITGFSAFAVLAGCNSSDCKTVHINKSREMHKHNRQLDEIDKLLILVSIEEKKQMYKEHRQQAPIQRIKARYHGQASQPPKRHGHITGRAPCPAGKIPQMSRKHKKISGRLHCRRGSMNNNSILKSYLLKNYPKEIKELAELKKNNDKTAKDILERAKKIVTEAKAKIKAEHEQFAKMVMDYKKSKDPELAKKIKEKLSEFYDMRLVKMKEKIDKEYKELKRKKADKDKEISKDFERITK